jgi:hypothetical protein
MTTASAKHAEDRRRRRRAASTHCSLPAPGLDAFLDGNASDQQADARIQAPRSHESVAEQADQQRAGEIGAQHVLPASPVAAAEPS